MKFDRYYCDEVDASDMVWYAFGRIVHDESEETLTFYDLNDQPLFQMRHDQDCCETVRLEDVVGDLDDLIGTPIFHAEAVSSTHEDDDIEPVEKHDESYTWTFYKFTTMKGSVTLRWYGTSNGHYSESVSIYSYKAPETTE